MIDEATRLLIEELQLPPINEFDVELYKKDASVDTFSVKFSTNKDRLVVEAVEPSDMSAGLSVSAGVIDNSTNPKN